MKVSLTPSYRNGTMLKFALLLISFFSLITPTHAQENMTLHQWAARFKMKVISVLNVPEKPFPETLTAKVELKVYPNGRVRDIKVVTRPRSILAEAWIIERLARIRNVQPVRTDGPFNVYIPMALSRPALILENFATLGKMIYQTEGKVMSITVILGLLGSFVGAIVGAKRTKASALYSLIAVAVATAILAVLQLTAFDEVLSQIIYIAVIIAVTFGLGLRRWQLLAVLGGAFVGAFVLGFVGGAIEAILHAGQNRSG